MAAACPARPNCIPLLIPLGADMVSRDLCLAFLMIIYFMTAVARLPPLPPPSLSTFPAPFLLSPTVHPPSLTNFPFSLLLQPPPILLIPLYPANCPLDITLYHLSFSTSSSHLRTLSSSPLLPLPPTVNSHFFATLSYLLFHSSTTFLQ